MSGPDSNLALLANCVEEIASLRHECARLPGVISGFEAQARQARERIVSAREALESAEKERRALEAQLEDYEQQRIKFQGQTVMVKTNVEYTALLAEIDGITNRIGETEDEILGLMEQVERGQQQYVEMEGEQTAVEAEATRRAVEQGAVLERAQDRLEVRCSERDELTQKLGPDVERVYSRVSARGGTPVARIKAGNCSACHRSTLPEIENRVLAGELHTCQHCMAILVVDTPDGEGAPPRLTRGTPIRAKKQ